jgi:hypothetical protein
MSPRATLEPRSSPLPTDPPSSRGIFEIGCGFRASKVLLSAVELNLFAALSGQPLDAPALTRRLGLHERGARDFFDALVALGILKRDEEGLYSNTPEADLYLDCNKPSYIGALFEQYNAIGYGLWGSLTEALRTGSPQIETTDGRHLTRLYADPRQLRIFVKSMTGASRLAARTIAARFPWSEYRTVMDIGTAEGCFPVEVALAHPQISGGGFDLPELQGMFEAYVGEHALADRLQFHGGDFFSDVLPTADVIVLGRILHNWDLDTKRMLLRKAYDALPKGGTLIVYETFVTDDRRSNATGLLASLNMLLWTAGGFDCRSADCVEWMRDAGFRDINVEALVAGDSMVIGRKP